MVDLINLSISMSERVLSQLLGGAAVCTIYTAAFINGNNLRRDFVPNTGNVKHFKAALTEKQ